MHNKLVFSLVLCLLFTGIAFGAFYNASAFSKFKPVDCNYTQSDFATQESYSVFNDYQCWINVTYDSDMQTDFLDIRFADLSGNLLDYCLDDQYGKVDSGWAAFFVETGINSTMLMEYDNTTNLGNRAESCEGTFLGSELYDNFDDASINATKWQEISGAASGCITSEGGGELRIDCEGVGGAGATTASMFISKSIQAQRNSTLFETAFKRTSLTVGSYPIWGAVGGVLQICQNGQLNGIREGYSSTGATLTIHREIEWANCGKIETSNATGRTGLNSGTWYYTRHEVSPTTHSTWWHPTNNTNTTPAVSQADATYVNTNHYLGFGNGASTANGADIDFNWVRARKFTGDDDDFDVQFGAEGSTVSPPVITWVSQSPTDINTFNLYDIVNHKTNITYTITAGGTLDESNVTLYHRTNDSSNPITYFVNGSNFPQIIGVGDSGWLQKGTQSNNTDSNFTWAIDEDYIYPGTWNLDHKDLETTPHIGYTLDTASEYLKTELFNISTSSLFGVLEFDVFNTSDGAAPLRFYYCNSSYSTGNPATIQSCTNFFNLESSVPVNHSHGNFINERLVPFTFTGGGIGGVEVTTESYFLMRGWGNPADEYNASYVSNVSRTNAVQFTTNGGTAWSNLTGTTEIHLHQYGVSEQFCYFAGAIDGNNQQTNDTETCDIVGLGELPPTAPNVFSPINQTYQGTININWTAAISPQGDAIANYSIDLFYSNFTFLKNIDEPLTNFSYVWDSTGHDGSFIIEVIATDNESRTSMGLSEEFRIDESNPVVTIVTPVDNFNTTVAAGEVFNMTCADNNLLNCTLEFYYSNATRISYQNQNFNFGNTSGGFFTTLYDTEIGNFTANGSACDGHTKLGDETKGTKDLKGLKATLGTDWMYFNVGTTIAFEELNDRIKFEWNETVALSGNLNRNVRITSPNPITIMTGSLYAGHIVSGKLWADFQDLEDLGYTVKVTQVNTTSVNVAITATGLAPGKYVMDPATGSINCAFTNISYQVEAAPPPVINLNVALSGTLLTGQLLTWTGVYQYSNGTFIAGADCDIIIQQPDATNATSTMTEGAASYVYNNSFTQSGSYLWFAGCQKATISTENATGSFSLASALPNFDIFEGVTPQDSCINKTHNRKTWRTIVAGEEFTKTSDELCTVDCMGNVCRISLIREGGIWSLLFIIIAMIIIFVLIARKWGPK